jgi:hypothetical protein
MRTMQIARIVLAVAVISSCVTSGGSLPVPDSNQITTNMLLDASPLAAGVKLQDLPQVDILELSPEMIAFIDRWVDPHGGEYFRLWRLLYAVMGDGTFDVIYDGTSRPGVRIVSFAPILKHGVFRLAELLQELLHIAEDGTSSPVEIEFAANLGRTADEPCDFGFLQMRPLALSSEAEEIEIGDVLASELVCRSTNVLGNGKVEGIHDIIVVDRHRFDRNRSRDAGQQVGRFNAVLQKEGRPYLLVGVGRWGSADPYLGIPVAWNQIAGARAIVEAGFRDFRVTPSQGAHFFQNLTSCNVGYFTVNSEMGEGFVDWDWLAGLPAAAETEMVRHIRLEQPVTIKMSGKTGQGVVLKPKS